MSAYKLSAVFLIPCIAILINNRFKGKVRPSCRYIGFQRDKNGDDIIPYGLDRRKMHRASRFL